MFLTGRRCFSSVAPSSSYNPSAPSHLPFLYSLTLACLGTMRTSTFLEVPACQSGIATRSYEVRIDSPAVTRKEKARAGMGAVRAFLDLICCGRKESKSSISSSSLQNKNCEISMLAARAWASAAWFQHAFVKPPPMRSPLASSFSTGCLLTFAI